MDHSLLYAIAITVLLVSDVLLVVLGVMFYRRRGGRDNSETAQQIDELTRTLAPLAASLSGLDQRLGRIEEKLSRSAERSAEPGPRSASREGDHRAFEVAARLVSQGAGVEELINICGLTRGEAELVRRLYGGSQTGGLVKDKH